MGKKVPRRLRRFARQGIEPDDEAMAGLDENRFSYNPDSPKPEEKRASSKEIAAQLAREEVQRFKEKHQRLPEKEEYDSISESIYAQLKDKEKRKKVIERLERKRGAKEQAIEGTETVGERKRKHGRPVRGKEGGEEKGFREKEHEEKGFEEPEERTLSKEEIEGMSVEDLFSGEKNGKEKGGLGELEKVGDDEFSLKGLEDMEESASSKCPKCGAETESVIFCPECGTAFCEKCAKRVEMLGGIKTFVCPDCGKKIKKTLFKL